jgi:hypothetical protein
MRADTPAAELAVSGRWMRLENGEIYGKQWQYATATGNNKIQIPLDWLVFGPYVVY